MRGPVKFGLHKCLNSMTGACLLLLLSAVLAKVTQTNEINLSSFNLIEADQAKPKEGDNDPPYPLLQIEDVLHG